MRDSPKTRAPIGVADLSLLDRAFLVTESLYSPCHVAYLSVLTPPAGARPDFGAFMAERLRAEATPVSPFNLRLNGHHGGWWMLDPSIDMS